jgi:hypothetical protein
VEKPVTIAAERRASTRLDAVNLHDLIRVRIKPGVDVAIVNVSTRGLAIETATRLVPGSTIDLRFSVCGDSISVRGRVLRCMVSRLTATHIRFRSAVHLETDIVSFNERSARVLLGSGVGN